MTIRFRYFFSLSFVFVSTLLFAANGSSGSTLNPVQKSQFDSRDYDVFTLKNGMRVLVVSDAQSNIAAASIAVSVGYYQDPPEHAGLSHLLEHMLFLGNSKFPEADGFKDFVNLNGGWASATTGRQSTRYYFEVNDGMLSESLDRLSALIKSPLIAKKYLDKEINAVDAEFTSKIKDDWRRTQAVLKATSNPLYPQSKFSGGNRASLLIRSIADTRRAMTEFHEKYYSASGMTLVLYGKESVKELKKMAERHFFSIKCGGDARQDIIEPRFLKGQLGTIIRVKTNSQRYSIDLRFPILKRFHSKNSQAGSYLAWLLSNKTDNSIFAYLRKLNLARSISTNFHGDDSQEIFNIYIPLTKKGFEKRGAVIKSVFAYLNFLSNSEHLQYVFDEFRQTKLNKFNFPARQKIADFASELSLSMLRFPTNSLLNHSTTIPSFEKLQINQYLKQFSPKNMRVLLSGPDVVTDKVEKYYGVEYSKSMLSSEQIRDWSKADKHIPFEFPKANPFIDDLSTPTTGASNVKPALSYNKKGVRVWYKRGDYSPRVLTNSLIKIYTSSNHFELSAIVSSELYIEMINRKLTDVFYQAKQAGLKFELMTISGGFQLQIEGFSQSHDILTKLVIEKLTAGYFSKLEFEHSKSSLIQYYNDGKYQKPYKQVQTAILEDLYQDVYSDEVMIKTLRELNYSDFTKHIQQGSKNIEVEAFLIGNVGESDSKDLGDWLVRHYDERLTTGLKMKQRPINVGRKKHLNRVINIEHPDSSIAYLIQAKNDDVGTIASYDLSHYLLSPAFFSQLRTEKQLGYVVHINKVITYRRPGLVFVIQSPSYHPDILKNNIDTFLASYSEKLQSMNDGEFLDVKNGLISKIKNRNDDFYADVRLLHNQLSADYLAFDLDSKIINSLRELSKEEYLRFFRANFLGDDNSSVIVSSVGASK
jgi:secreted Zn-dependent insulinase-like peptidase